MNYHCGPYWMPQCLKRILSFRFNYACSIHDIDYREQDKSREECDKEFLMNMLHDSKGILGYLFAVIFFYFVRKYGQGSWDRNHGLK